MLFFVYGQDSYRSKEKLNEIIEQHKKANKSGLNLRIFDNENLNYDFFENEASQISMFSEKKLIIFKDVFLNKKLKEKLLESSSQLKSYRDVMVFYETSKILKSDKFFKLLLKLSKSQEFLPLAGIKLFAWIKDEFKKYEVEVDSKVIEKLIAYCGSDSWKLSSEIKKLVSYNKKVSLKNVETLIKPNVDTDIFKTIDAIAIKDKNKAIRLLHKHLDNGDNPLYLLSMVNFQIRNLLLVKSVSSSFAPNNIEMHPYVFRKTLAQAKNFTFEELKKSYLELVKKDFFIKTGKIDSQLALDLFVSKN